MKKSFKACMSALGLVALLTLGACGGGTTPNPDQGGGNNPGPGTGSETVKKKYTVTWKVEGEVVETDTNVEEGTTPTYNGAIPSKQGDAQYSYTFKGWDKDPAPVSGDITYNAVFEKVINKYTVTFNTNGGSAIAAITKDYGTSIEKPATDPTKDNYRFVGWALNQDGTTPAVFPFTLKQDVTIYAIWNKKVDLTKHLVALLDGVTFSPLSYIPDALLPGFEDNLIANENAATYDFDNNYVNVATMKSHGYAEQWNMVIENLQQSMTFFKYLSIIEAVTGASVDAFNNYMDKNPSDTASHSFKLGTYDVTIVFDGELMSYALGFTTKGGHTAQIWLTLNTKTGERAGRFQIGDKNALKYIVKENSYEFALRLVGVRRSYFKVTRAKDGSISGQINEHTGLDGKVDVKSAAQFFINDKYTAVVGNKVEGMLIAKKTVVELYNTTTGHLIGYEVQENIKDIIYNTLWFNLNQMGGINNIKIHKQPDEIDPSTGEVTKTYPYENYLNNSTKKFEYKTMGLSHKLKALSRRFDIELRDRFFCYKGLDEDGKDVLYKKGFKIPMIFIQEEVLDEFVNDINKENKGLNVTFNVPAADVTELTKQYKELIPAFNEVKDTISQEWILEFIGTKFVAPQQ